MAEAVKAWGAGPPHTYRAGLEAAARWHEEQALNIDRREGPKVMLDFHRTCATAIRQLPARGGQ